MTFDFDKAKAVLATNPIAAAFLDANKTQLQALTEAAIMQIVNQYLSFNDTGVVTTFYSLDAASESLVTTTADIAKRQADFKARVLAVGKVLVELIISALMAGVVL
jgi:hypothetical protein